MTPKILLVQRVAAEGYPPVLNQARVLESLGNVTILDTAPAGFDGGYLTPPSVRRVRLPAAADQSRLRRLHSALNFRAALMREMELKPDVVVAYEAEAAALLLRSGRKNAPATLVVHLHEHPSRESYAPSFIGSWSLERMLSRLHMADAVVVADTDRALALGTMARLAGPPIVVMNCPLVLDEIPESKLLPALRERGLYGPIVHYHGAVGPDHGLEAAIRSMEWWPADAAFAVVGGGSERYFQSLRDLATTAGVSDRLIFFGRVKYDEVFAHAAGADVGLTMLDTSTPNWRLAAGASNKRFEYMALGIPQVTNPGPGIDELFTTPGVALVADPGDPRDVAAKINSYLESPPLRSAASEAARRLHLHSYNYQRQLEPLLEFLRERLAPTA